MPRAGSPSNRTSPASAARRPATILRKVDLPQPMNPTIETNSPRATVRLVPSSTCRTAVAVANVFDKDVISMNATSPFSTSSQPGFGHAHQPIEGEADEANRQDREQDVRVDEAVVLLPEE